jgi:hypothetical protein
MSAPDGALREVAEALERGRGRWLSLPTKRGVRAEMALEPPRYPSQLAQEPLLSPPQEGCLGQAGTAQDGHASTSTNVFRSSDSSRKGN